MAALPPLASIDELAARVGRDLTSAVDLARAGAVLDDASAVIRRVTHASWVEQNDAGETVVAAPDEVVAICLRLAVTAFTNPNGVRQESIGSYSYTLAGAGDQLGVGAYLTPFEMRVLGSYRASQLVTTAVTEGARPLTVEESGIVNLPEPDE